MNLRSVRSLGLSIALCTAAAGPFLANCAAPEEMEEELSEDAVTGVRNALGLGLTFDAETGQVQASLKDSLKQGEVLRIRVRRGTLTSTSQKDLQCDELDAAKPLTGAGSRDLAALGKVTYRGPKVDASLIALKDLYNDHRWQSDSAWSAAKIEEMKAAGGPHAIIEACITKGSAVRAKLQTHLALAWDEGNEVAKEAKKLSAGSISFLNGDAGAGEGGEAEDPGAGGNGAPALREGERMNSMEKYAELCVQDLGEIPFFKKLADGKYDTFDCRDFMGTGDGHGPVKIDGVEGAMIPLTQDDRPKETCDREKTGSSYNCVDKCDKAEYLSEGCEPGPTVTTAKNAQGSHWVLLCRKVADPQRKGMTKTKKFDDIAMIGHNPKTGKTCFFQNSIGSGTDGEHVTHPADVEKSRNIWDSPKGYCNESCHTAKPFIHSPWIDGAKRANGKPIVPRIGEHPDFEISWADAPYYIVNMDAQGWTIPKQLVSDESAACATCHKVGGGEKWLSEFANWTTGKGTNGGEMTDSYWSKITDSYKQFEKSHWMPPRLDNTTAATWETSKWGQAMAHINKCRANRNDPSCVWADVPRGPANPARPNN